MLTGEIGLITFEEILSIIMTLVGGYVAFKARSINNSWKEETEKIDKMHKTYQKLDSKLETLDRIDKAVFGVEDMSTMEGMVDVIEQHDEELQHHSSMIEEAREEASEANRKVKELRERIEKMKQRSNERTEG